MESFQKHQKLRNHLDFKCVFDASQFVWRNHIMVTLGRSNNLGYARIGLVVSKKVSKRAVIRNRIKRLLRETFRQYVADKSLPIDFVCIIKRNPWTDSLRQPETRRQYEAFILQSLSKISQLSSSNSD